MLDRTARAKIAEQLRIVQELLSLNSKRFGNLSMRGMKDEEIAESYIPVVESIGANCVIMSEYSRQIADPELARELRIMLLNGGQHLLRHVRDARRLFNKGRFGASIGPLYDGIAGAKDALEGVDVLATRLELTEDMEGEADSGQGKGGKGRRRKPKVNDRMTAELAANLETVKGWTAKQWATKLNCGETTVKGTKTWKSLQLLRQQTKAEKKKDRRGTRPV